MSVDLTPPSDGSNPYEYYRAVLNATKPTPTDKTGLKARLCVIFVILAYTFFASFVNFGVHLYSNKLKGRTMWIFRLVRRQGGTHIVSNHFVLSGLIGVCCIPVLTCNAAFAWTAFVGDGHGIETMFVLQFSALPVAYFFGWLLSWATFQSFLQVEGGRHRSRLSMPAWLENIAFVGGCILTVGCLIALTVLASVHNNAEWETFDRFGRYLDSAAASWEGSTLSTDARTDVASRFAELSSDADRFYASSEHLAMAGAILPAILLIMNGGMWFFVHSIRKQVSFQLSKLTTVQVTAIKNGDVDDVFESGAHSDAASQRSQVESLASPEKQRPQGPATSPSFDRLPTFIPLSNLGRKDNYAKSSVNDFGEPPLSPPPAIHFVDTIAKGRNQRGDVGEDRQRAPTRGKIRALSQNPDRLARDQAERLMSMMKAEQELLVLSCSIFSIAAALIIWCAWSIPKLKNHSENSWADDEGLFLAPLWFYSIGLAFAETLHAWVEWRHLRPWRTRTRSGSGSGSNSNSLSGGARGSSGLAVVPSTTEHGAATAVQVQVHVVTQHEVVELDEYEMGVGSGRVGGQEAVGVALGGGEEDVKRMESFEEEKRGSAAGWEVTSTGRGMGMPSRDAVWRD
ncbi:hypothetical protein JCM6882_002566 [Rhodosporidiobolus microsporus]